MAIDENIGDVSINPRPRFRVLMTDWEAERAIAVYCNTREDAQIVASYLAGRSNSVQIDLITKPRK